MVKKKVKKGPGPSTRQISDWFDDDTEVDGIEVMLAAAEQDDHLHPQRVFNLSELVATINVERQANNRELIALPRKLHRRINELMKRGMRKGTTYKAEGYWKDSYPEKFLKSEVIEDAKTRTEEIYKESHSAEQTRRSKAPMSKEQAKRKAAEEAQARLSAHGIELSIGHIIDLMSKPRLLDF